MKVLVGPTFTVDVPSQPASYSRDHQKSDQDDRTVPFCLFLKDAGKGHVGNGSGYRLRERPKLLAGDSSESSSSIGAIDESGDEEEEEEEEAQSKFNPESGLSCLDSVQDSLPIKRGLSGYFDGRSKSFTDLTQVSTVKELQKQENPINKRRKVLMASKWSRISSFYAWSNPKSMPLLPLDEDDEECSKPESASSLSSSSSSLTEENKQDDQLLQNRVRGVRGSCATKMRLGLGRFKSRSLSLADLQEHDDEEEDD